MPRYKSQLPLHTTLPLPSKLRQIDGLQMLRAVAVIEVAWVHGAQNLNLHLQKLDFSIFGVDIFFVISGFILSSVVLREKGAPGVATMWEFLKRRLIRIFPTYWIFAFLSAMRLLWSHQNLDLSYLPSFLLLPSPSRLQSPLVLAFGWTLLFEMFFYYVLAALLVKVVRFAVPSLIGVLLALVFIGRIFGIRHPILIVACNPMQLEFVFGALLALGYMKFGKRRILGIALVSLGIVLCVYWALYFPKGSANGMQMIMNDDGALKRTMTWGWAAAFIVGGIIFWAPDLSGRLGKLMVILGTASYSSYLASPLIIEYVSRLLYKVGGAPTGAARVAMYHVLMTVGVLGLGWVCYDLVEWPVIRGLQGVLLRKRA